MTIRTAADGNDATHLPPTDFAPKEIAPCPSLLYHAHTHKHTRFYAGTNPGGSTLYDPIDMAKPSSNGRMRYGAPMRPALWLLYQTRRFSPEFSTVGIRSAHETPPDDEEYTYCSIRQRHPIGRSPGVRPVPSQFFRRNGNVSADRVGVH
ncbi:hypothetical protein ACHAW6_005565 [Cyclotella cf. meneghiniana]